MKIQYRVQGGLHLDSSFEERIIEAIAAKAEQHFAENIGPHAVAAAKAVCPVSSDRNFKPRRSSFSRVQLVKRLAPPPKTASPKELAAHQAATTRLSQLRKNEVEVDLVKDREFFRGTGTRSGEVPDELRFHRGGVAGAFRHRPGNLKRSIKFDGVHREGNRVIGVMRAHASYAHLVHQGFTHVGGKQIAPQKFLVQSFPNIVDPLMDPKAYG